HIGKIGLAGAALCLMLLANGTSVYAVTGIVNSDEVYVRSQPSTSAGVVGYASKDYHFEVGNAEQDDEGMTWYQITLEDGSTGYIRSDFVDITTDDLNSEIAAVEESSQEASTESAEAATSDSAPDGTDGRPADGYTIEQQSDGTWALVSADTGEKIPIGDLQEMKDQLAENEDQIKSAASHGRNWAILIACVIGVVAVLDTLLYKALHKVTGFTLSVTLNRLRKRFLRYQKKRAGIAMENQLDLMEQAGRTPDERPTIEIPSFHLPGEHQKAGKAKGRKPGAAKAKTVNTERKNNP
ncbi:MAG: SH3 domain-containing protein, partial [Lachnospiraceae bacterium]